MLQNVKNGILSAAAVSRYRQAGLDDQVLRYMADLIRDSGKFPPDFLSQSPELTEFHKVNQQKTERSHVISQPPKLGMSFQKTPSSSITWRRTLEVESRPLGVRSQPNNPWNRFSVKKTFPAGPSTQQRVVRMEPTSFASTRHSLGELRLENGSGEVAFVGGRTQPSGATWRRRGDMEAANGQAVGRKLQEDMQMRQKLLVKVGDGDGPSLINSQVA